MKNLPKGYGYTTGTSAQAATKASLLGLILGKIPQTIDVITKNNTPLTLNVLEGQITDEFVVCAIRKYSGDDPDVTNGLLIFSKVSKTSDKSIVITGGKGVGTVTKKGLNIPIGDSAINAMPLYMIKKEILQILDEFSLDFGVKVEIFVPQGEEIAKKTYNPRLGIINGISIIGTTGIVEPMSTKAIIDTIKTEMNVLSENLVKNIIITPGNYGKNFVKTEISDESIVKCSNFLGDALDFANSYNFENILIVGHIGKFIKVCTGIFNTHSNNADARLETLVSCAVKALVPYDLLLEILDCITVEDAVKILNDNDYLEKTMYFVCEKFDFHIKNRYNKNFAFAIFSTNLGLIGKSSNFNEILEKF